MVSIARKLISLGDVKLFCLDNEKDKDAIICLHGRWGRAETWMDFIRHYAEKYRIIAPDQRGHGLSDKPIGTYTVEEMADDVVHLADRLGVENYILVGHSMGGGIAAYVAATRPETITGLAILDKSPNGPPKKHNAICVEKSEAVDPITEKWPIPFPSLYDARKYIEKEMETELSRHYFMNSLVEENDGIRMMYSNQAMASNIANYHEWYDLLPRIKSPTVVMRANSHEAVNDDDFRIMKERIENAMAFEISDPDHNIHLSKTHEFYTYFDLFLEHVRTFQSSGIVL